MFPMSSLYTLAAQLSRISQTFAQGDMYIDIQDNIAFDGKNFIFFSFKRFPKVKVTFKSFPKEKGKKKKAIYSFNGLLKSNKKE